MSPYWNSHLQDCSLRRHTHPPPPAEWSHPGLTPAERDGKTQLTDYNIGEVCKNHAENEALMTLTVLNVRMIDSVYWLLFFLRDKFCL